MPKPPSDKLLKLLYESAAPSAAGRVNVAAKAFQSGPPQDLSQFLALDKTAFSRKPMEDAITDLSSTIRSNILRVNTYNSLISNTDFYNIYPKPNDRQYRLPAELKHGIKFTAVKARHPSSLAFANGYYLIFPSFLHAATYYLETALKSINGQVISAKFCAPSLKNLSQLSSPWLDFQTDKVPPGPTSPQRLFDGSKAGELLRQVETLDVDTNYQTLLKLVDFPSRKSTVLVRNLPLGINPSSLARLLWDYEFPVEIPLSRCFKQITSDALRQVHVMLIRFADEENAGRFVRSFHGTKWQGSKGDVTRFHEPILCETLE